MANNDYISNIFADDTLVGGDIRQTLQYNLVKTYPSVNSTNGGQIHSEENVRWLTRQFTKKPFIIPYFVNIFIVNIIVFIIVMCEVQRFPLLRHFTSAAHSVLDLRFRGTLNS